MPDGGTLWRLQLTSEEAQALRLIYDTFRLPPGAKLFVYSPDRSIVRGAYTTRNNKADHTFATDFTPGPSTILEYYEPGDAAFSGRIQIGEIVHAWTAPQSLRSAASKKTYEPTALSCSINTPCPIADEWTPESRATVLIDRGGSTCSGVLLNNVRGDLTPYVLTAHHCGEPSVDQSVDWIFKFNYASTTCDDPSEIPSYQSITGATVRVANDSDQSDVLLLELSESIPNSYEAYFAGWSADGEAPTSGVVTGHPQGDIRKATFETDPPLDYSTRWVTTFDQGTIEAGSSGSPLFDESHRVIGHTTSALALDPSSCSGPGGDDNDATIIHPKLSYNWTQGPDGAQLVDFLDPDGTGTTTLDGLDGSTGGGAIPVELISFDALRDGSAVVLRWKTASETENAGFEVQHRRPDDPPSTWTIATFVGGAGTTQRPQTYRYRLSKLAPGTHLFRLKQIDLDGTFSYSSTVEITVSGAPYQLSTVVPHPLHRQGTFSLSIDQSQHVRIDLFDVLGRRVTSIHNGPIPARRQRRFTIPARQLSSGLYLLRVTGETFSTSQRVAVVQ